MTQEPPTELHPNTEETEEPDGPPDEQNFVFLTADCGCRFQIVGGLPVINAGVLAMPDLEGNVCEQHKVRQEAAQAQREEKAKTNLTDVNGNPL